MDELPRLLIAGHPWTFWLGWTWTLSSVVLTTWIILQRKSPVSTLAWIMVLNLMPVVGLLVYAYFGPQRIKRQRLKRWHKKAALMSKEDLSALRAEHTQAPLWAQQHAQLIDAACGLPMSSAQSVDILPSGGATLEALLHAIDGARGHIHLEYYIFEPDETGSRLLRALAARARQGVKVRLLVDAIGSPKLLSRRHRARLNEYRDAGGEFAVFHPTRLDRLRPLVNLRTHRKIVVVDGRTGFVGGINVNDDGNEQVRVHRGDGLGIAALRRAGIPVLILSTEVNPVVGARARKLSVPVIHGVDDKGAVLRDWCSTEQIDPARVLYAGNDVNDLGCFEVVGWPVAVASAHPVVRDAARLVTTVPGGHGAVREIASWILGKELA